MFPTLFTLNLGPWGQATIYCYGAMIAVGVLIGATIASWRASGAGLDRKRVFDLCFATVLGGLLGAKVFSLFESYQNFDWRALNLADGGMNWPSLAAGVVIGSIWLWRRQHLSIVSVVAVLVGSVALGRALYLAQHASDYSFAIFTLSGTGLVFWGGVVGGLITAVLGARFLKIPFWPCTDLIMPSLLLGLGFGRIGCFLGGCCWGTPTNLLCAVRYPPGSFPQHDHWAKHLVGPNEPSLAVHPAPLYEAAAVFTMFFILVAISRRRRFSGETFWWGIAIYSAWRFFAEFYRGDNPPYWPLGLTFSQGLCLFGLCAAAVGLLRGYRRPLDSSARSA